MHEVRLELEAVTPVFIAGADQRIVENEGLRPQSLRGLMRWWFRAVAGSMVSSHLILRKKENEIFGSTEMKSKVTIVSNCQEPSVDIPALPPKQRIQDIQGRNQRHPWFSDAGKTYLWFSIKMQRSKSDRLRYYKEGTKFTVILRSRETQTLKIAASVLWLLLYLGGVGLRNRRGAGCLKVSKYNATINDLPFAFAHDSANVSDVKKYLEDSLAAIFDLLRGYIGVESISHVENVGFCILSRSNAKIALVSPQGIASRPLNILEEIGVTYSKYRRNVPIERRRSREVLGLPLQGVSDDRFSSPLAFGVLALKNGYIGRVVKFYSSVRKEEHRRILKYHLDEIDGLFAESPVLIPSGETDG